MGHSIEHGRSSRRRGRLIASGLVAASAAGLLGSAGCDSGPVSTVPSGAPSASSSPSSLQNREFNYYFANDGPCKTPFKPDRQQARDAGLACIASRTGVVDVVNFGFPQSQIQAIAEDMTKDLQGSGVDPKFRFVNASAEAEALLQKAPLTAKGCVDVQSNPTNSASFIAAYTMQEQLRNADYILAFSNEKPCGSEGGQADTSTDKYADMYLGEYGGIHNGNKIAAVGGAHELLHLLGLGHAGLYAGRLPDGSYTPFQLNPSETPFNLAKYLKHGLFDEYGDLNNVMGDYYQTASQAPRPFSFPPVYNDVQTDGLEKPLAVAEGNQVLPERTVNNDRLTISVEQADKGIFALTHLNKSVKFANPKDPLQPFTFDTLAFVPISYGGIVDHVTAYLVNFSADATQYQTETVDIGDIELQSPSSINLTYFGQKFTVGTDGNNYFMQTSGVN